MKLSCVLLATSLAACGGAPAVPLVVAAVPLSPVPDAAASAPPRVAAPPALAARATLVAQAKVEADALGWTADGARVALTKGGVLSLRDARTLSEVSGTAGVIKAPKGFAPILAASRGTVLVVGGVPFELPSGRRLELPLPKGCDEATYSADGARASTYCMDATTDAALVLDAQNGTVLGHFDEFHSAAPVRVGTITESGKFVQWRARASGAFEEISSHVVGPEVGSQAVMSPDERYLFLAVDLDWYTEDQTPPKVVTSRDGKLVATLPHWVRGVDFSPRGSLLLARASNHGDVAKEAPRRSDVYESATGKLLLSIDVPAADVTKAAFSPDERELAILAKDGTLRIYALELP